MDEEVKNVNATDNAPLAEGDMRRPKLKKVKRPVRRIEGVPGQGSTPNLPIPPRATNNSFNEASSVDSYLDDRNINKSYNQNTPRFVEEKDPVITDDSMFMVGDMFTKKAVALVSVVVFVVGFLFAKIFFTQETIVKDGLQDVIVNPEVPRGRPRCGLAEKTQGCVLYIMNPQRQELNARDFYDLAAQLTGRQRFIIETGNMRYSGVKIKPGEIAQLNIPPLQ